LILFNYNEDKPFLATTHLKVIEDLYYKYLSFVDI